MKVCYQIGRFDKDLDHELTFEIENQQFKTSLSSFALWKYFSTRNEQIDVILLYPISLFLNRLAVE
ncbi:MAG: hypothetical protein N2Z40_01635, partial [Caldimicrobium sp.]|nr:hypothetical protein [Caldimicrobium sp.]